MEYRDQDQAVLNVLQKMKVCIDANETYVNGFNLHQSFGICWHVFAHTPENLYIGMHFLEPIFIKMGLDYIYPVEMQIVTDRSNAELMYRKESNIYNPEHKQGQLRIKLLNDLIQYFNKELELI